MSCPGFVIVAEDESGKDNSVFTAVLDDKGNQVVVDLSEAEKYHPLNLSTASTMSDTPPIREPWKKASIPQYKCDLCEKVYIKPSQIRKHKLNAHQVGVQIYPNATPNMAPLNSENTVSNSFLCSVCGLDLANNKDWQNHILETGHNHIDEVSEGEAKRNEYLEKLVIRDPAVISQVQLELENLKDPPPKRRPYAAQRKYPCPVCKKLFVSPSILDRHSFVHTRERLYPCPHCPKLCPYSDERLRHIRRAHPEMVEQSNSNTGRKPRAPCLYTCSLCKNKTFTARCRYVEHLKVHLGGLLECDLCSKKFTGKYHLQRHKQWHARAKKHDCDECSETFFDALSLRNHKIIHSGEFPYKCGVCGAGFIRKKFLYEHLNQHSFEHNNPDTLKCRICWEIFPDILSYNNHKPLHAPVKPISETSSDHPSLKPIGTTTTQATAKDNRSTAVPDDNQENPNGKQSAVDHNKPATPVTQTTKAICVPFEYN